MQLTNIKDVNSGKKLAKGLDRRDASTEKSSRRGVSQWVSGEMLHPDRSEEMVAERSNQMDESGEMQA